MSSASPAGNSPHRVRRSARSTGIRRRWTARCARTLCLLAGLVLVAALPARAQTADVPTRTQSVPLRAGWNSVFIDVEPTNPEPGVVFTNLPVTKVAAFFPSSSPVEYIQDPAAASWKQQGWRMWYAPSMPESAVSDLRSVRGGQGYLVYASAPATLSVTGEIQLRRYRWRSDSFNFVGFPASGVEPPTFATWFAGSTAQRSDTRASIYSLDAAGYWRPVLQPGSTLVQPGVAYWVFSKGGSDYQGPLDVSIPVGGGDGRLDFGAAGERLSVRFSNPTGVPVRFSLELSPSDALPLEHEERIPGQAALVRVPVTAGALFGPVEAGGKLDVRLVLDRARLSGAGAAVITVRDDVGSLVRIPVTARNP
jgi:hypothetical protein